ncbi:hypothetical protein BKA70DRAFT_1565638 [Coprinopsis sp. MPI-PUGE-AT-0042]|nr:hypothetical protein BKA70DRAFT_1565638 [Coprinopsis sp. MPI-PUGE-AT-0042]
MLLPTEMLHKIAADLSGELSEKTLRQPSDACEALRNLALTSRCLRDISQPHLYHNLSVSLDDGYNYVEWQERRIQVFRNNPRLLDYVQRFSLDFVFQDVDGTHFEDNRECFPVFCAQPWKRWNEATRRAINSCLANNPIQTVEIDDWEGPLEFLGCLPASVVTLKVISAMIDFDTDQTASIPPLAKGNQDGKDSAPQLRPKELQLNACYGIPPFILKEGTRVLSQLHTLELIECRPTDLKPMLSLVPQTLVCLQLRYSFYAFEKTPSQQLGKVILLPIAFGDSASRSTLWRSRGDPIAANFAGVAMANILMVHFTPAFAQYGSSFLG